MSLPDSTQESGGKVWRREIYVLEEGAGAWKTGFQLGHPLAYGAGVSSGDSLILMGGRDADRHYRTVYRLPLAQRKDRAEFPPGFTKDLCHDQRRFAWRHDLCRRGTGDAKRRSGHEELLGP